MITLISETTAEPIAIASSTGTDHMVPQPRALRVRFMQSIDPIRQSPRPNAQGSAIPDGEPDVTAYVLDDPAGLTPRALRFVHAHGVRVSWRTDGQHRQHWTELGHTAAAINKLAAMRALGRTRPASGSTLRWRTLRPGYRREDVILGRIFASYAPSPAGRPASRATSRGCSRTGTRPSWSRSSALRTS